MQSFAELIAALDERPEAPCQDFVTSDGVLERRAGEVLRLAREASSALRALGIAKGDRVGLMLPEPREFLPLMHACLLSGVVAVPLHPPPLFGQSEPHARITHGILRAAGARLLVAADGLRERLGSLPVERAVTASELSAAGEHLPDEVNPTDLALLQFTSGSTGEPKGVQVTHGALLANARAIMIDGLSVTEADSGVSWLPLHHDMGLIGFGLAPLLTRTKVTFIPTARFVRNPAIWLQTLSNTRATITFAPNFAYALTARRVSSSGLDLSRVRMWGCGAEPIAPDALAEFERQFAGAGVRAGQISPCYGLAEATLAVTFTPPSFGRVVDEIDAQAWEERGVAEPAQRARSLRFVSCGTVLAGHELRILDAGGAELGERERGEIVVSGPSVASAYFADPGESARAFRAGRLHTGDLGYIAQGRLFVTGRIKDTLIMNGRNYSPHLIEEAAASVEGVRMAAAVNVPAELGDELVILVERSAGDDSALGEQVRARVAAAHGVHVSRVVGVSPGSLPRTTSGKLRRSAARALL